MKKIVILSNHDGYTYNFRKEIIQQIIDIGYKVYIVLPYGDKIEHLKSMGCNCINLPLDRRGINPIQDISLFIRYLLILKNLKPNLVMTYTIKPNLYGGLACTFLKIPYINNITGLGSGFGRSGAVRMILKMLYKIGLKKSSCIFFQNNNDFNILRDAGLFIDNYQIIPGSGVNLEEHQFEDFPVTGKIIFNYIGRIMLDKGIDHYLDAAKFITEKYAFTYFNVIGFIEPSEIYYEDRLIEFQDQGYIKYLGFQDDIHHYIKDAHCIIQPSYSEGLSNVLLETGAAGRVLISSNIAGCREIIDEEKNGYTFEPKNTEDLISKIEQFINLPFEKKKAMGFHSRQKVENEFDRTIVVDAYIKKIKEILK